MGDEGGASSRMRAAAHPVRLRVLSLLTGAELSATDVARELDLTHANASYHLRTLERAGLIEVAGEEKVRGGVVKRYRHPFEVDLGRPATRGHDRAEERELFHRAAAEELVRRGRLAVDGAPGYSADAELWVSPEAYARVRDLLAEAGRLLHADARPPRTPGTVKANLTTFLFRMRDERENPAERPRAEDER